MLAYPPGSPQVAGQVYADKAFENFYNLELDEAAALYQKALKQKPENPDWWAGLAHVRMFLHLRAVGRLDRQVYTASNDWMPPAAADSEHEKEMWDALARAYEICERRLASNPNDVGAHYGLGLAYAIESSFHINARGKALDALKPATKAKEHHERVRQLDPSNHDANFVIGVYEYAIGSVPVAFRWVLYLIGHSGSKQHGVALIHDALVHGKRVSPPALVTLAYIYAREKQHRHSRQMLRHLMGFYPRNPIFAMEAAATYSREGDPAAAAAAYEEVARKFEQGAPGYQRLNAPRLFFQIADTHDQAKQRDQARANYLKALDALPQPQSSSSPASAAWEPYGRLPWEILLRVGAHYQMSGDAERAREYLGRAANSPDSRIRSAARTRLKTLR